MLVVTVNTSVEVLVMMMLVLEEAGDACELELLTVDCVCDVLELDEDATGIILKYTVMVYNPPALDSTSKITGTVRPTKASGGSI